VRSGSGPWRILAALILVTTASVALAEPATLCSLSYFPTPIGVTLTDGGDPLIVVESGSAVREVAVFEAEPVERTASTGLAPPPVRNAEVWRVVRAGDDRDSFEVGAAAAGYRELTALGAQLDPDSYYLVVAIDEAGEEIDTALFVPSELAAGEYTQGLSGSVYRGDEGGFRGWVSDPCGTDDDLLYYAAILLSLGVIVVLGLAWNRRSVRRSLPPPPPAMAGGR